MLNKNILLLFLCQTSFWTMSIIGITLASLIGLQLAPIASLATLPIALLTLSNIITTLPLSIIMQRYGRKLGFSLGAGMSILGGLLACYGMIHQSFGIFCLANGFLGVAQGSAMYYRLAATDGVPPANHGKAIAWVMSGGIVAAIIAPSISLWSQDLLLPTLFAGAYAMVTIIGILIFLLCLNLTGYKKALNSETQGGRSTHQIIRQPVFITAVLNTACGHGVMILIMVATPLAIKACGYTVNDAAHVIQWHVLGMFIPSFFSGRLIDRFGAEAIGIIGSSTLVAALLIATNGLTLAHFYSSLFFLGLGWNFMYSAGSTLLTRSHTFEERGSTQGAAELIASIVAAIAAFASGVLLNFFGWDMINWVALLPLILTAMATWQFKRSAIEQKV